MSNVKNTLKCSKKASKSLMHLLSRQLLWFEFFFTIADISTIDRIIQISMIMKRIFKCKGIDITYDT